MIIIGSYQAASEYRILTYGLVYVLWLDIEPDSDYGVNGSSDEGSNDQENLDDQEQGMLSAPRMNPRRIIWGDQRSLIKI